MAGSPQKAGGAGDGSSGGGGSSSGPTKSVAEVMLGAVSPGSGGVGAEDSSGAADGGSGASTATASSGGGGGGGGGGGVGGEGSEWQPYKDPDSGSIFWYNTVTHVSQWECPLDDIDFQAGADNGGADSDDDDAVEVMGDDDLGI